MTSLVPTQSKASMVDVLIVGAGPAGIMAANALARAGVSVRIVDKRSVIFKSTLLAALIIVQVRQGRSRTGRRYPTKNYRSLSGTIFYILQDGV